MRGKNCTGPSNFSGRRQRNRSKRHGVREFKPQLRQRFRGDGPFLAGRRLCASLAPHAPTNFIVVEHHHVVVARQLQIELHGAQTAPRASAKPRSEFSTSVCRGICT